MKTELTELTEKARIKVVLWCSLRFLYFILYLCKKDWTQANQILTEADDYLTAYINATHP